MLRDIEAAVVILNLTAVALGYLWRRRRQTRRKHNEVLEHIRDLERDGKQIDEALKRIRNEEE